MFDNIGKSNNNPHEKKLARIIVGLMFICFVLFGILRQTISERDEMILYNTQLRTSLEEQLHSSQICGRLLKELRKK